MGHREEEALYKTYIVIFLIAFGIWGLISATNMNKADTVIGETFLICPLCGSKDIVVDFKAFTLEDRVLCRNCLAEWRFRINPLFSYLTDLYLVDEGKAADAETKKYHFRVTLKSG